MVLLPFMGLCYSTFQLHSTRLRFPTSNIKIMIFISFFRIELRVSGCFLMEFYAHCCSNEIR